MGRTRRRRRRPLAETLLPPPPSHRNNTAAAATNPLSTNYLGHLAAGTMETRSSQIPTSAPIHQELEQLKQIEDEAAVPVSTKPKTKIPTFPEIEEEAVGAAEIELEVFKMEEEAVGAASTSESKKPTNIKPLMIAMCAFTMLMWDTLPSSAIYMLTLQLTTHLAAGFLGYAMPHRLRSNVTTPEAYRRPRVLARVVHALLNLGVAFRLGWVFINSLDYTSVDLTMHVLLALIAGLLIWIMYISVALGDSLMGEEGFAFLFFYFLLIMMNYTLIVVTLGPIVATIATWFAVLGLSGFLGFCLRVYNDSQVAAAADMKETSHQDDI